MRITDLAVLVQGAVEGDGDVEITGVSAVSSAKHSDLTFALDEPRLGVAERSRTACILTTRGVRKSFKPLIRVRDPKLAFSICFQALHPPQPPSPWIHPSAVVDASVKLGKNVHIGPQVVIEDDVTVGDNVLIDSGCVIKKGCSVGDGCHLYPRVVLYGGTVLNANVVLHAGVVVGADGFGYVKDGEAIHKFPQIGRVVIGENVEIGANSTIDRGALDDTVIGANSKLDNLCHIAHNVKMGRNVIMAAQCGIAGSTVIGDNVVMSGQIAVIDNVVIGDNAVIGGKSAVIGPIHANAVVWGIPARPLAQAKRQMAVLAWLTRNFEAVSRAVKGNT